MIFPLIPIPFGRIQLYQKPIRMHFGERKLTQLCRQELGREPKINELFLFFNTKRDTLKLFWRDGDGSQEIVKALPRGGFMLPAPRDGEAFVTLAHSKLESVFRAGRIGEVPEATAPAAVPATDSGRLHRQHPAKTEVRIYDYVDREVPMLMRMFEKRLATYRAIGYARGEAPLGFAEPIEERTVEYDQEALRHFQEDPCWHDR